MDLRKEIKESLVLGNNNNNLTDESFRKLLDNAFASLLNKPDIHNVANINSSKSDVVKEIYAALLTLIVEISRNNLSIEHIGHILGDELNFSQNRKELFCKMYEKQKDRIQIALSLVGSHFPHIVDVNWKMDHIVKTNTLDESTGPIYRIRLSTEVYDEKIKNRRIEYMNFNCNTQQLQDLVYKLKDAVRHCERISNEH